MQFDVVVVRAFGTVVVSACGQLERPQCTYLDRVLTDLIEDPANLTVAVDLASATLGAGRHMLLVIAACRARRRGTRFIVKEPAADTAQALRAHELGDLAEILPRRTPAPR
ncbi:MAG: hypothetical protein M3083_11720 [Actinomycetota bacterium]|nr:hypothetical protein [Actinomycetota bacterium]